MLRRVEFLTDCEFVTRDGETGKVEDVLFDDREWTIREFIVRTGSWLTGTRIVILPQHVSNVDSLRRRLEVTLTRSQLDEAPLAPTNDDELLSRFYETALYDYYTLSYYWVGPYLWGSYNTPLHDDDQMRKQDPEQLAREHETRDSHLRSFHCFDGANIRALDGAMGDIEDMIVNDGDWQTRHLVVDTRKFLLGRNVLIPPQAVLEVDWDKRVVHLRMTKAEIQAQPRIDSLDNLEEIQQGGVVNVGEAA